MIEIKRKNYTVEIEDPEIYVDNEARRRSGHMSHAMAEFAPNCFIEFNSNCSATRCAGHSAFGWIEYRISRDGSKTYSDVYELELSKQVLLDGDNTLSVEKAIACDNGDILAFCLRNSQSGNVCCEPWITPWVITSSDEGESWSEPREFIPYAGRVYDVLSYNGAIYVMFFCNDAKRHFCGNDKNHLYRIYKSTDNGKTFEELSVLSFEPYGRGYGNMIFDSEGILHAYAYNVKSEKELDHAISRDCGKTWELLKPCYLANKIRNPQIALIDGVYLLHGRGGDLGGFVMYTSEDATNWDEGTILSDKTHVGAFYSENLNLKDENGNFLLIQYSDTYDKPNPNASSPWCAKVNAMHIKVRIKK